MLGEEVQAGGVHVRRRDGLPLTDGQRMVLCHRGKPANDGGPASVRSAHSSLVTPPPVALVTHWCHGKPVDSTHGIDDVSGGAGRNKVPPVDCGVGAPATHQIMQGSVQIRRFSRTGRT